MNHKANPRFWAQYRHLPAGVQRLADRCYRQLKQDEGHPSLHLKKVGRYWSVRIGVRHRALGVEHEGTVVWFWIGPHAEYDRLIAT